MYEVEIRIATIGAVEEISKLTGKNAIEIDWVLWQMGEAKLDEMKPHHRVLSIFY